MLKVDLGQLERAGRLRIDGQIAADDSLWAESGVGLVGDVRVRLEAQKSAQDVVIRGRIAGTVAAECRRCLTELRLPFDEPVTWVYRYGTDPFEAESAELYWIAAREHEIDLARALREHVILVGPRFPLCSESCRGLCPHCGANLNHASCTCVVSDVDERWSALRRLAE